MITQHTQDHIDRFKEILKRDDKPSTTYTEVYEEWRQTNITKNKSNTPLTGELIDDIKYQSFNDLVKHILHHRKDGTSKYSAEDIKKINSAITQIMDLYDPSRTIFDITHPNDMFVHFDLYPTKANYLNANTTKHLNDICKPNSDGSTNGSALNRAHMLRWYSMMYIKGDAKAGMFITPNSDVLSDLSLLTDIKGFSSLNAGDVFGLSHMSIQSNNPPGKRFFDAFAVNTIKYQDYTGTIYDMWIEGGIVYDDFLKSLSSMLKTYTLYDDDMLEELRDSLNHSFNEIHKIINNTDEVHHVAYSSKIIYFRNDDNSYRQLVIAPSIGVSLEMKDKMNSLKYSQSKTENWYFPNTTSHMAGSTKPQNLGTNTQGTLIQLNANLPKWKTFSVTDGIKNKIVYGKGNVDIISYIFKNHINTRFDLSEKSNISMKSFMSFQKINNYDTRRAMKKSATHLAQYVVDSFLDVIDQFIHTETNETLDEMVKYLDDNNDIVVSSMLLGNIDRTGKMLLADKLLEIIMREFKFTSKDKVLNFNEDNILSEIEKSLKHIVGGI